MADTATTPHLDDSELLHLVDRDASAWELDRWSKHALSCQRCSERLQLLQRRTSRFSRMLEEAALPDDFAYPQLPRGASARARSRPATGWLRAAAVALVLLLPLVAVDPLRAWVSERWTEVVALLESGEAQPSAPAPLAESGSTLWFTPAGGEFVVEISSEQRAGQLILRAVPGPEGSLEVVASGGGETPVLVEQGIRIQTSPTSAASYALSLPETVRRVRIEMGQRPPVVLSAEQIGREIVFDLGSARSR